MEFKEELINKFKKIYEFVIDYLDERIEKKIVYLNNNISYNTKQKK